MKTILLSSAILLLIAAATHAQSSPQSFDNFDTRRGAQVQSLKASPSTPVSKDAETKKAVRRSAKHYLPSPLTYSEGYKGPVYTAPSPIEKTFVRQSVLTTPVSYSDYDSRESFNSNRSARPAMRNGSLLKGYSTGDDLVDMYIIDSSRRYSIDPLLIYSQMSTESAFRPRARSNKGASGLMQLMPASARRLGVTDIYDPRQNIEGGVKYMRLLLDMFDGDVNLALAGYNAGEGAVIKYGYQIPPYNETQAYVSRISARYRAISYVAASRRQ